MKVAAAMPLGLLVALGLGLIVLRMASGRPHRSSPRGTVERP